MPERAQRLAEVVASTLFERDHAARRLGITLDGVGPGRARLRMAVREDMLDGHGICHGGVVFSLADTAFAYACNACNQVTVAAAGAITFLAPARCGDVLTADAEERHQAGRRGIYDVAVTNQEGTPIAVFHGTAHRSGGEIVPGLAEPR